MAQIPFPQSERCFRRYEKVIEAALKAYPKAVRFTPQRAITTEVARCRDSIASYRKSRWVVGEQELFAKLDSPQVNISVWSQNDKVYIGFRKPGVESEEFQIDGFHNSEDIGFRPVITDPVNDENLMELVNLIDTGVLPFTFSMEPKWEPNCIKCIGDKLNVACHVENGRLILY